MDTNFDYDVVVLGGGIAGLLIASELSEQCSVALIEREHAIPHNKYWLTNQNSYDLHPELQPFVETTYDSMDIEAYQGEAYQCYGKYYLWNTAGLLTHLQDRIKGHKGEVLTATSFVDYKHKHNGVEVHTDKATYSTKLIIDCMGYASPIINRNNLLKKYGYYVLYGATLKLKKSIRPIGFCNPIWQKRATYFEVFPTDAGKAAHAVYISLEEEAIPYEELKHSFINFVKNTKYDEFLELPDDLEKSQLGGVIPIGVLKKPALNRVYFFGESCQLNPASTATGLTRMLYKYKDLAKELAVRIDRDDLSQSSLCDMNIDYLSAFNRNIQLNIFQESLTWDSDNFLQLVNQMRLLDNKLVYDLLFGDLTKRDIFTLSNLLGLLKSKNTILLRSALKAVIGFK